MKIPILILFFCISNICTAQFISEDDLLHFGAGAVVSGGTYTLVYSKTKNKSKAFWYSLAASTLIGIGKEIYDATVANGYFDTGEMVATVSGGLVISYSFSIFNEKRKKKKKEKRREAIVLVD